MKRLLLVLAILLMACSTVTTPLASTQPPPPVETGAGTNLSPTSTLPAAATSAEQPTQTPYPTFTPLPTFTSTPNKPPTLSITNAIQVELLANTNLPEGRKVAFSPDGKLLATSAGNQSNFAVEFWRTDDLALVTSIKQFNGIVWDIAFSPDGQFVASAADDPQGQTVRIWGVPDGSLVQDLRGPTTASSVAFSPDGRLLAVGGLTGWPNGVIWVYDTRSWNIIYQLPAPGQNVTAVAFTPDGSLLATSGTAGQLRFWQTDNGTMLFALYHAQAKQANSIAYSPDGGLLASVYCTSTNTYGCQKGGALIWQSINNVINDEAILQDFKDLAESVAFSPDGQLFATASGANDPKIRLRSVTDWQLLKTLPGPAFSIAFSPDMRLIASVNFTTVSLWGIKP